MSDFDVEECIENLLLRYNTQAIPGWTLRDYLRQELRAAEARGLERAAPLMAACEAALSVIPDRNPVKAEIRAAIAQARGD